MVRCAECGFLSARNTETRNLEEIEFKSRQDGNIGKQRYVLVPVCFAMTVNFDKEAEELRNSPKYATRKNEIGEVISPKYDALVKVILSKERECESFIKWHQGSTPKEHQEMMDREAMLKWQDEREEADRNWREQQEKWHSREEWRRYIFMAIITVMAVIIGVILGYFIK